MKKLLLCCAAALAAGLFQVNAAEKNSVQAPAVAPASYTVVERGVAGKQIGDYTYVYCVVMHVEDHMVVGVEPTPKVYRDDRYGRHDDVTAEVLRDYKVEFDKAEGCINYSYGCQIGYEWWSGSGSLYPLM